MPVKAWKYEVECKQTEIEISRAADREDCHPAWVELAFYMVDLIRKARSKSTPLALHFICRSSSEMLKGRHDESRLCLLVAKALVVKSSMDRAMKCFAQEFYPDKVCKDCGGIHGPPPGFGAIVKAMESMFSSGEFSVVKLPLAKHPPFQAQVAEAKAKKRSKFVPKANPLN